jgi:uncharacterized protein YukJ
MPIAHYGLLKGRAVESRQASGANPHYQVRVADEADEHRIAINVQSQDGSDVAYLIDSAFRHPITELIEGLPLGFRALPSTPAGGGLDYIRGNLADPREFVPLPFNVPGPDNDLNEKLDHYVQRAMADERALVYAFGQQWGPEPQRDKIFGFKPGSGIHDIHMNQGNDAGHKGDDGVWQDGGLIFQFPDQKQWVAFFLKFQSQAWHTDDKTGHALPATGGGPPSDTVPPPPLGPDTPPTTDVPDGLLRIVAALANDTKSPERETVTIINTSNRAINLAGWQLADKAKNKTSLGGSIEAGATQVVLVKPPMALSNKGGIITLLDDGGRKVHGVSYTKAQASNPGWTIVF